MGKLTTEQLQECIVMYNKGIAIRPIASHFNVSRNAVWELLSRRITLRANNTTRSGSNSSLYRGGSRSNHNVYNLLNSAIAKGILIKKNVCETCGDKPRLSRRLLSHHDDYNKPLKVRWLCPSCHYTWHATNNAIITNSS
jgi:transposase-like protein